MTNYKLTNDAKEDLIRIHQFGVQKFGTKQADTYFHAFFQCFEGIAENPFQFESVDHIKAGYRRCVCGADSIYFRVIKGKVEIISIIGRQQVE